MRKLKRLLSSCTGTVFLFTLTASSAAQTDPNLGKIEKQLRGSGHYQLIWISRSYPYVVEACLKFSRFSFTFNKKPRIKNKSELGECRINQPALPMRAIMTKLEKQGYNRLSVRGVGLTGFRIIACQDNQRYILEVNHWGGILDRHSSGKCEISKSQDNISVIR